MKKYDVKLIFKKWGFIEGIEAESEEQAIKIAESKMSDLKITDSQYYDAEAEEV